MQQPLSTIDLNSEVSVLRLFETALFCQNYQGQTRMSLFLFAGSVNSVQEKNLVRVYKYFQKWNGEQLYTRETKKDEEMKWRFFFQILGI